MGVKSLGYLTEIQMERAILGVASKPLGGVVTEGQRQLGHWPGDESMDAQGHSQILSALVYVQNMP